MQMKNVYADPDQKQSLAQMKELLLEHQQKRHDQLVQCTDWKHWLDDQRRVVKNAFGELSHPESTPDWSLLH